MTQTNLQLLAFDQLKDKAIEFGIAQQIQLIQSIKCDGSFVSGQWKNNFAVDNQQNGNIFAIEKIKNLSEFFKKKAVQESEKYSDKLKNLNFAFKLQIGNKLPIFQNIQKVYGEQIIELFHKQNQVLLIDVWATWCGPCQNPMKHNQQMLQKNVENWKDKVRIVAVSVDEQIQTVKKRIQSKKWTSIEHLKLNGWDNNHDLIKMFEISGIPFVCLVDKSGIINYVGHPSSIKLEDRINELINKQVIKQVEAKNVEKQILESKEEIKSNLIDFNKIKNIIEHIPQQNKQKINQLSLSINKTRKWSYGSGSEQISKLKIKYTCSLPQKDIYENYVKSITDQLQSHQYDISAYVKDPHLEKIAHLNKIKSILQSNNVKTKLFIQKRRILKLNEGLSFTQQSNILFSKLNYGQEINSKQIPKIQQAISQYFEELSANQRQTTLISKLSQNYQFYNFIGTKFSTIPQLKELNSQNISEIKGSSNKITLISLINNQSNQKHYKKIVQIAKKYKQEIEVKFLSYRQDQYTYTEDLLKENENLTILKIGDLNREDLRIYKIQSWQHLIVIDKFGFIRYCSKIQDYQKLETQIKTVYATPFETASSNDYDNVELIELLQQANSNQILQILNKNLKDLDYTPKVNIEYSINEYFDNELNLQKRKISKPKVSIQLRQNNKSLLDSLWTIIKNVDISQKYIIVFDIPTAKQCTDCKQELKLPYYFYYWSSSHRCVNCAHKQVQNPTSALDRYVVKQNGILVFGQTNVDVQKLGKNWQPSTVQQCRSNSFGCDGCGSGPNNNPRYICLGCRRLPSPLYDFVDFCHQCAQRLINGSQTQKQTILDYTIVKGHKHELTHSYLRINWGNGYKNY